MPDRFTIKNNDQQFCCTTSAKNKVKQNANEKKSVALIVSNGYGIVLAANCGAEKKGQTRKKLPLSFCSYLSCISLF